MHGSLNRKLTQQAHSSPYCDVDSERPLDHNLDVAFTEGRLLRTMIFHLYDHYGRHLSESDSLDDLKDAALLALRQNDLPYGFIRWSDARKQRQEMRVTAASLTEATLPSTPSAYRAPPSRSSGPKSDPHQRANLLVGVAITFLVLLLTSEIAAIILR